MKDKKTCCICEKTFYGYGNNPAPVKNRGKCCDSCSQNVVIPARHATWLLARNNRKDDK